MTIAVLCAAVVGSVGGGLTALHVSPSSSASPAARATARSAPAVAPPAPAPARDSAAASPTAQPHAPDPHAVLVIQIRAVLGRVAEWSHSHAGAPCPDAATLGIAALDPWGHPIELTCTDQPADQIMGATSAGPDGVAGNSDDVKSWNLGPSVAELVQGHRWPSKPAPAKPPSKRRKPSSVSAGAPPLLPSSAPAAASHGATSPASAPSVAPGPPIDAGDDIPTRR